LNDLAGRCQWEWWRSLSFPAGRAIPCIKLLPLPSPRGRHWPVGGFQQCGVCVLSSCCSLSVVRPWRLMLGRNFLPVLACQARLLYLSYSLLDSGRAGLLVSFPKGMVSCRPGQVLVLELRVFCRVMCLLQCESGCMGRRIPPWRRAASAGLLVSFPVGMVSCNPGPLIFCWVKCLLQCWCGCMGRRVPPWQRAGPAVDQADV